MWNIVERRIERSRHLDMALTFLLRSQRERGELDAIALTTEDGTLVASDGPPDECNELAAYAPLLARGLSLAIDPRLLAGVTVHSFMVGKQELVLVMRGRFTQRGLVGALALSSMQGATRILCG